jgi:hypothetical protein
MTFFFDGNNSDHVPTLCLQISRCMKAWAATFGCDSIMQSLSGQVPAVQAAFQALIQ